MIYPYLPPYFLPSVNIIFYGKKDSNIILQTQVSHASIVADYQDRFYNPGSVISVAAKRHDREVSIVPSFQTARYQVPQ